MALLGREPQRHDGIALPDREFILHPLLPASTWPRRHWSPVDAPRCHVDGVGAIPRWLPPQSHTMKLFADTLHFVYGDAEPIPRRHDRGAAPTARRSEFGSTAALARTLPRNASQASDPLDLQPDGLNGRFMMRRNAPPVFRDRCFIPSR